MLIRPTSLLTISWRTTAVPRLPHCVVCDCSSCSLFSLFPGLTVYLWYSYMCVSGLYELWKTGRYKSYPPSVLVDLTARILALVPPWTRVYRVQRSALSSVCLHYYDSNYMHLLQVVFSSKLSR